MLLLTLFKVQIDMANSAFDPPEPELSRILRELADRLDHDIVDRINVTIKDINGNTVGFAIEV